MKYRTKIVEIDAYQWLGDTDLVLKWFESLSHRNEAYNIEVDRDVEHPSVWLQDVHVGTYRVEPKDWLICDGDGHVSVLRPYAFEKKYIQTSVLFRDY